MADSVIFNSPLLLSGYIIAALLCAVDLFKPSSGYIFPILSVAIFVATTAAALILGAEMKDTVIFVLVFLMLNLPSYKRRGGDEK